jgi:hypothetical protein
VNDELKELKVIVDLDSLGDEHDAGIREYSKIMTALQSVSSPENWPSFNVPDRALDNARERTTE